jgi:hypothetical protein
VFKKQGIPHFRFFLTSQTHPDKLPDNLGGHGMKCDRCGNDMAYEQFFGDQERFGGWRCIFCGEIVDDVVMENRGWLRKGVVPDNKKTLTVFGKKAK